MRYTAAEIKQREASVDNAIGSLRLEGLEPDQQTIDDLRAEARGEISMEEVRARALTRIQAGP